MESAPPAPGRPPTNLHDVVGWRDTPEGRQPVNVIDRVTETIAGGAFLHDAAARVGVSVETLRRWRTVGQAAINDMLAGRKRMAELTQHQQRCAELVGRMDRAEADAKLSLSGTAMRIGMGGQKRTEVTERRDSSGNVVERSTRVIEAAPDAHALTWYLSHRWPDDYGRTRLEVTGAGGGPLQVDLQPVQDRLRAAIDQVRANMSGAPAEPAAAPAGSNGTNGHHEGNGASPEP